MMAVFCGCASFVPWVAVVAYPLTLAFGLLGATWSGRGGRGGRLAALAGIAIGTVGVAIQLALALVAIVIGWLGGDSG
jgi:hypothetical protein